MWNVITKTSKDPTAGILRASKEPERQIIIDTNILRLIYLHTQLVQTSFVSRAICNRTYTRHSVALESAFWLTTQSIVLYTGVEQIGYMRNRSAALTIWKQLPAKSVVEQLTETCATQSDPSGIVLSNTTIFP